MQGRHVSSITAAQAAFACFETPSSTPLIWRHPCALQELLGQGFTFLATGTDVGLMSEAAARNAAFASKLRST